MKKKHENLPVFFLISIESSEMQCFHNSEEFQLMYSGVKKECDIVAQNAKNSLI